MKQAANKIEWKDVKFQDLASFLSGFAFTSSDYSNKGLKLIRIQNLGNNKNEKFVCWDKKYNPKYIIKKGDLLLSLSGTVPVSFKIFKWNKEDALLNQRIVKIILNEKNINESYLSYNIQKNLIKIYSKATSTTGIANVKIDVIRSLKILLPFKNGKPDLKEQERIVSILEKAEKQKERSEKAEELLDEYLKSVFNEMFYNGKIEKVKLEDVCKTSSGGTPSRAKKEYWENGTIPWIKSGDLNKNRIIKVDEFITELGLKNSSAKYVEPETVLIAMYGATAGKTSITKIKATTNQAVCALVPDEKILNKIFLLYWLRSNYDYIVSLAFGGGQPNISQQVIRSLKLPLPPLSLQQKFAKIVKRVEGLKENVKKTKQNSKELFDSLMQKAFMGEL